jgi:hypothetical protein
MKLLGLRIFTRFNSIKKASKTIMMLIYSFRSWKPNQNQSDQWIRSKIINVLLSDSLKLLIQMVQSNMVLKMFLFTDLQLVF